MLSGRPLFSPAGRLLIVALLLGVALPLWLTPTGESQRAFAPVGETTSIPLYVIVVFDQMRGDYLIRWHDLLGPDGFRRILDGGAWFQNCHYTYANTVTGPGHASLATGAVPADHGIIDNDWYERRLGASVYCAASDRYENIPPPVKVEGKKSKGGVNPDRLLRPTFADRIKEKTNGRSRVVSLSFKDRSAALLGGRQADVVYWVDGTSGAITTSNYYRQRPHEWVRRFNAERSIDQWYHREWTPLHPQIDFASLTAIPKNPASPGSPVFRHRLPKDDKPLGKSYYDALYDTPFGNEIVLELTKRAIVAEQLGRHTEPDLLCVSFSCNDPVGHRYGPDSPEVLDVTLHSDSIMRDLLALLDRQVGRGRYLLALSADHGVCPLPEVSLARGRDAGRIPAEIIGKKAEEFLAQEFGKPSAQARWIAATHEPWVYLNYDLCKRQGNSPAKVEEKLAGWLAAQPGVQTTFTRAQLLGSITRNDALTPMVRRSFHVERSGDVMLLSKRYYVFTSTTSNHTSHGTPHDYDTHVPLLFYGPEIPVGVYSDKVAPQAMMAVLSRRLGAPPAPAVDAYYPERWR